MNTPLRVSKGYASQVKYAVLMPLFFFVFCFVYNPFSLSEFYDVGGKSWTFHLLMLSCIMIGVLALTRLVFTFLYKYIPFNGGIMCSGASEKYWSRRSFRTLHLAIL